MTRSQPAAAAAATLLALACMSSASAQTAAGAAAPANAKPKSTTTKKAIPPSRKEIKSEAKGLALAQEVTETINDNQLLLADRVLTGQAKCEFNQTVDIEPVKDKPGFFSVGFNKATYTMTPQETTTGAIRLEDKRNGIVWLQIPTKSMMMNQKVGQRMVDGCTQPEQRAAMDAVNAAATAQPQ